MRWILSGSIQPRNVSSINLSSADILKVSCESLKPSKEKLNFAKFWEIENTGSNSETNKFDHKQFIEKIRWNSGRYTVPLPWKLEHDILPDNFCGDPSLEK